RLLREGDDLEGDQAREAALELEQALHGHEPADGVHVGEAAHRRGAVDDRGLDHRRGAFGDLLHRVVALEVPGDLDRLLQRLGLVLAHDVAEHALVEVLVGVDEPGHEQATAAVVFGIRGRVDARFDGRDAVVLQGHVERALASAQCHVPDDLLQDDSSPTTASIALGVRGKRLRPGSSPTASATALAIAAPEPTMPPSPAALACSGFPVDSSQWGRSSWTVSTGGTSAAVGIR